MNKINKSDKIPYLQILQISTPMKFNIKKALLII